MTAVQEAILRNLSKLKLQLGEAMKLAKLAERAGGINVVK
jgi:hypothetical protein